MGGTNDHKKSKCRPRMEDHWKDSSGIDVKVANEQHRVINKITLGAIEALPAKKDPPANVIGAPRRDVHVQETLEDCKFDVSIKKKIA